MQETQETWVRSLGWEDPLEEGMATHSNILGLENSIDRGAWRATVQGVTKSWIWLNDWTFTTHHTHLMWWKPGNTGVSGSRGWTWREAMLTGVMPTKLRGSGGTPKTSHKMPNQEGNLEAAKVDPKAIRAKCEPWSHRKSQQKMGQSLPYPSRHLVSVSSMLGLKVPKASVWTKHFPQPARGAWSTKPLWLLAQNQRWWVLFAFNKPPFASLSHYACKWGVSAR